MVENVHFSESTITAKDLDESVVSNLSDLLSSGSSIGITIGLILPENWSGFGLKNYERINQALKIMEAQFGRLFIR